MHALLEASCNNCQHWRDAACGRGMTLAEGEKTCDQYAITEKFKQEVVSAALQDGGIEIRIPLKTRARIAAQKGRPLKGFRATKKRGK